MPDPNHRQRVFVERYAEHGNGTRAAIEAGYAARSARSTASRLLTDANIVAAMDAARAERVAAARALNLVTQEEVIRGLLTLANDKQNTLPNVRRLAWVDLGKHLGMFVHRIGFTAAQLDAAAEAVSGEYDLEGMEDLIAADADRILRKATRQQGRMGPPRYRGRGPAR